MKLLRVRHLNLDPPRFEIHGILQQAGLYHAAQIRHMTINNHLISALVERWRPETHTFHFPCGECTVTLEDVAIQLGLRVNGMAVTGITTPSTAALLQQCEYLLGARPGEGDFDGGCIKLLWLTKNYRLLSGNGDIVVQRIARAYILSLLGYVIVPDKSDSEVHGKYLHLLEHIEQFGLYSWGSACLAVLYRALDRASRIRTHDICGSLTLLQAWAYLRLPFLAPIPTQHFTFPIASR